MSLWRDTKFVVSVGTHIAMCRWGGAHYTARAPGAPVAGNDHDDNGSVIVLKSVLEDFVYS